MGTDKREPWLCPGGRVSKEWSVKRGSFRQAARAKFGETGMKEPKYMGF